MNDEALRKACEDWLKCNYPLEPDENGDCYPGDVDDLLAFAKSQRAAEVLLAMDRVCCVHTAHHSKDYITGFLACRDEWMQWCEQRAKELEGA